MHRPLVRSLADRWASQATRRAWSETVERPMVRAWSASWGHPGTIGDGLGWADGPHMTTWLGDFRKVMGDPRLMMVYLIFLIFFKNGTSYGWFAPISGNLHWDFFETMMCTKFGSAKIAMFVQLNDFRPQVGSTMFHQAMYGTWYLVACCSSSRFSA